MGGALTKFDISDNTILADGGKALAAALKNNQVMKELNLASNRLGQRDGGRRWETDLSGVVAISDAIPTMGALVSLDLSQNDIPAERVAKALKTVCKAKNTRLK